jgi:hypothetical protein
MNNRIRLAQKLVSVGLVSEARFRRLQIHESYWILRDAGTPPGDATELVAEQFGASEDTVEAYSRNRAKYSALDEDEPTV